MSRAVTTLSLDIEHWPLETPLRDRGGTLTELEVLVVTLEERGHRGKGEAAGVYYLQDDVPRMLAQIEAVRARIELGTDRHTLLSLLPPGGARNAIDCAFWDLEAHRDGRPAYELAGIPTPVPLVTTYTLGAEQPDEMAERAVKYSSARALKLKLTGDALDVHRVHTVRAARPDVWLSVDANQGFTRAFLDRILPDLVEARVEMIEQPLPVGREAQLEGWRGPIPLAADESAQDIADLPALIGRFEIVNIKLDKCGGLTAALAMAREAQRLGLDIMIGNMTGTTLAMAPAFLVGQLCRVVDLDGPLFLGNDRSAAASYEAGRIWCPQEAWGFP
ncbi:MAG: dipeptide epimerase [Proteobacteria bacterium]|nr:dipeptide epimerase [Pseudomonadota bacterium]